MLDMELTRQKTGGYLQLFQERLSSNRSVLKSVRDNVERYYIWGTVANGCLFEVKGIFHNDRMKTAQTHVFMLFLPETLRTSVLNHYYPYDTNRHCRVRFYACVGQPLSRTFLHGHLDSPLCDRNQLI